MLAAGAAARTWRLTGRFRRPCDWILEKSRAVRTHASAFEGCTAALLSTMAAPTGIARQVDEAALLARLALPGLVCVESFSEAWGPCTALQSTLRRFIVSLEPQQQDGFESLCCKAEGCRVLSAFVSTSLPRFLLYRNGVLRATVEGANPPALLAALNAHVPRTGEATEEDQAVRLLAAVPQSNT